MPFASKRQLQTCFGRELSRKAAGKKPSSWKCSEWLGETPDAECLPVLVEGEPPSKPSTHAQCRKRPRASGPEITQYYRGMRGGLYFYADGVRIYVPADAKAYVEKNFTVLPASKDPLAKKQK
jgi:hypothetical protein